MGGSFKESILEEIDLDRHVHGVGERVVQCCEVLGGVITREYRRELGGGVAESLWGGK